MTAFCSGCGVELLGPFCHACGGRGLAAAGPAARGAIGAAIGAGVLLGGGLGVGIAGAVLWKVANQEQQRIQAALTPIETVLNAGGVLGAALRVVLNALPAYQDVQRALIATHQLATMGTIAALVGVVALMIGAVVSTQAHGEAGTVAIGSVLAAAAGFVVMWLVFTQSQPYQQLQAGMQRQAQLVQAIDQAKAAAAAQARQQSAGSSAVGAVIQQISQPGTLRQIGQDVRRMLLGR